MGAADIIMIFMGIISLLISASGLTIAFLTFLDQRNSKKKEQSRLRRFSYRGRLC